MFILSMGCCCSEPEFHPYDETYYRSNDGIASHPPVVYNFYFGKADEESIQAVKTILSSGEKVSIVKAPSVSSFVC